MAPSIDVLPLMRTGPLEPYYSQGLRLQYQLDEQKASFSTLNSSSYADIQYEANESKYLRRAAAQQAAVGLEKDVPFRWPKVLQGPLVWTGSDLNNDNEYIYYLTTKDKDEIQEALKFFRGQYIPRVLLRWVAYRFVIDQDLDSSEVTRALFPLPALSQYLEKIAEDIYEGRGFMIIRGLDPTEFSVEDFAIVYLGLSSYIAERRGKQDQRGSMIMHVMERDSSDEPNVDNLDKPFHTDTVCDCLCLVTRTCAAEGGQSILASAWTVYNELAATRPDLIHVLAKPDWPFDTFGRDPPFYKRALLYFHDGKIMINFSRRLLVGHVPRDIRTPGIPGLNEAQAEALDAVHFIARKHEFRPTMEKGDIRFVNNMGVLHRRESFENGPESIRHLVRIWLNNENLCWKLPLPLRLAWARVFDDDERGAYWDIEPPKKNGVLRIVAGSCD